MHTDILLWFPFKMANFQVQSRLSEKKIHRKFFGTYKKVGGLTEDLPHSKICVFFISLSIISLPPFNEE